MGIGAGILTSLFLLALFSPVIVGGYLVARWLVDLGANAARRRRPDEPVAAAPDGAPSVAARPAPARAVAPSGARATHRGFRRAAAVVLVLAVGELLFSL